MRPFLRQGDMPYVSTIGLVKRNSQKKGSINMLPFGLFFIHNEKFHSFFLLQCGNFLRVIHILVSRIETRSKGLCLCFEVGV